MYNMILNYLVNSFYAPRVSPYTHRAYCEGENCVLSFILRNCLCLVRVTWSGEGWREWRLYEVSSVKIFQSTTFWFFANSTVYKRLLEALRRHDQRMKRESSADPRYRHRRLMGRLTSTDCYHLFYRNWIELSLFFLRFVYFVSSSSLLLTKLYLIYLGGFFFTLWYICERRKSWTLTSWGTREE